MKRKIKIYAISILIALAVGGLSALVTGKNMKIYETINQPPLAPPGILFPIVWTILYILMGISSARIFMSDTTTEGLKKLLCKTMLLICSLTLPGVYSSLILKCLCSRLSGSLFSGE